MNGERPIAVVFFRTDAGNEPVREFLRNLPKEERAAIGEDLLTVQHAWPIGRPLVDSLGGGLWEVRSRLPTRIARTLFAIIDHEIVVLHCFIKKLNRRQWLSLNSRGEGSSNMKHNKYNNKHRGSNLRDLLREDKVLEAVEARAVKRALALRIAQLAAEQSLSKTEMATRMKTSRAAVDRLLDSSNPSMTLTTLGKAARVLGRKLRIELVPG